MIVGRAVTLRFLTLLQPKETLCPDVLTKTKFEYTGKLLNITASLQVLKKNTNLLAERP
jgi:hypothetical protein